MDFVFYMWDHAVLFAISSIPILTVYFLLKVFKIAPKVGGFVLCLMLLQSVFFWFKLKEVWLIIYQSVSYISAFLLIGAEFALRKKASSQNKNQTES